MDVKGLNGMVDEMMDMEVQPQTSTPMKNAERAKEKLESFYSKLPANLKLDESMALYARGISHMQNGDNVGALRQFRLAISSAVKMTRLHTEITKAISSLDRELSTRRKRGEPNPKGEKLYIRAEVALKAGNLAECATLIKEMKSEIFS
jgi:exonuclease VII small subunit